MNRAYAFAAILCLSPASALASDRVDICARYTNTGKAYHVNATSMTGSELNEATHSFNYNTLGRYIVIFWAQAQASVIEMQPPFIGLSYLGSSGTDQNGSSWQISAYQPMICPGMDGSRLVC